MNDCFLHKCDKKCGENHGHSICEVKVNYSFPECGHPAKDQKPCSKTVSWKCKKVVKVSLRCGHSTMKECWKKLANVLCKEPCNRKR